MKCPKCGKINDPIEVREHGNICVICGHGFSKCKPKPTPEEIASQRLLGFCRNHNINLNQEARKGEK